MVKIVNSGILKKKYYSLRYWSNIYKNMRAHLNVRRNINQKDLVPFINKPGIVFSFDDSYRVNDWYQYGKDMFGFYDVRATFNINACHYFEGKREHTQNEIDMLLDLQSNGHEIGHHGFNHKKATEYSEKFGMNKWVEDEIVSLLDWMCKQSHSKTLEGFKKPVSFVFPHFIFSSEHIRELVPKFFKIVRGHLGSDNLIPFNHSGFAPSICLDGYYSNNLFFIKKIMKLAKKTSKNIIITCHSILPEEVNWDEFGWGGESKKSGKWRTTPGTIKAIIDEARKLDMEFYTTSDIAGVATFIDPNFEKCVRQLISSPEAEWIPIHELMSIQELDLSNKEISNLDGIQYFINLERINLKNNNIRDFRLLGKLHNLKSFDISNNPLRKEKILEDQFRAI